MTASSSTASDRQGAPFAVPSGGRVRGRLVVPPSKSVSHRYFNLALLSGHAAVVERPLVAEDTELFLGALVASGFAVERRGDAIHIDPGPRPEGEIEIFCGNAGTLLRFLLATLAVLPGSWRLDGVQRLRERPVGPLVEALRALGAHIDYLGREGFVPVRIAGASLRGGAVRLDAGESSQYLSALLMAGLRAPEAVVIEVAALTSRPYVEVTLRAALEFGGQIERLGPLAFRVQPSPLRAGRVRVEGDFSAACYPAAAAALTGGEVRLDGLRSDSPQGDRAFLELLGQMGAEVAWEGGVLEVRGHGLRGIKADLSAMPDQVPTLAALAPFARGETLIHNVAHLRIKESDRLAAMAGELRRVGAEAREGHDRLWIPGRWSDAAAGPPQGEVLIDPRGDHRIAMSLALVGLRRPGVVISQPHVVGKSYPEFWRDLVALL